MNIERPDLTALLYLFLTRKIDYYFNLSGYESRPTILCVGSRPGFLPGDKIKT
jgi:hypothetical protein